MSTVCDGIDVNSELPARQLDLVATAWADFKAHPDDWAKFEAIDWLVRVMAAKWSAYALSRRLNAE